MEEIQKNNYRFSFAFFYHLFEDKERVRCNQLTIRKRIHTLSLKSSSKLSTHSMD